MPDGSSSSHHSNSIMKVAIIGGGVSGLSTLWGLNEFSSHETHLFESGEHIGGHTNTVWYEPTPAAKSGDNKGVSGVNVDTGFIVFNTVTYPNFLRFIKYIGLEILESDMSFAVTRFGFPHSKSTTPIRGKFEWAGTSPAALFCQWTNLFNPSHWRMVWDIIRFNNQSLQTLRDGVGGEDSIGQWLDQRGYGEGFRRNYLIPMTASIWSTPPSIAFSSFPAVTLLRFMHNHHLLQILDRPQWLTLKGGSQNYVRKVLSSVPSHRIHHGKQGQGKVNRVVKDANGAQWTVHTQSGERHTFDRVVFACHADTALSILDDQLKQSDPRRKVLSSFQFSKNEAVLHADEQLLPVARSAWAAWNFIAEESSSTASQDADRVSLTYWMNLLQSLPESKHGPVLVTLNPPTGPAAPRSDLISARYSYEHPVYTAQSVSSQKAMKTLQGEDGLYFAGAWLNYGFHEDGFKSGLEAARALGATLPFDIRAAEREVPQRDMALAIVNILESARRLVAPWVVFGVYPLVVITTCLLEAASGSPAAKRIRSDWADAMRGEPCGNSRWVAKKVD